MGNYARQHAREHPSLSPSGPLTPPPTRSPVPVGSSLGQALVLEASVTVGLSLCYCPMMHATGMDCDQQPASRELSQGGAGEYADWQEVSDTGALQLGDPGIQQPRPLGKQHRRNPSFLCTLDSS